MLALKLKCFTQEVNNLFSYLHSYLNFSTICARLVRRCLKPDLRVEALRREESLMKTVKWEGGKQAGEASKYHPCPECNLVILPVRLKSLLLTVSLPRTYIPNSMKVALAIGLWAYEHNAILCLSDRQTIMRNCQCPKQPLLN